MIHSNEHPEVSIPFTLCHFSVGVAVTRLPSLWARSDLLCTLLAYLSRMASGQRGLHQRRRIPAPQISRFGSKLGRCDDRNLQSFLTTNLEPERNIVRSRSWLRPVAPNDNNARAQGDGSDIQLLTSNEKPPGDIGKVNVEQDVNNHLLHQNVRKHIERIICPQSMWVNAR